MRRGSRPYRGECAPTAANQPRLRAIDHGTVINSAEAEPANLLQVAGAPLLKRLLPLVAAVVIVVVALVVWLR